MVELVVRLVFSLTIVVGLLVMLTRFSAKRFRGGSQALVRVVHRQPLSRSSAIAVVTVGSRVLVVGTTEQQVRLLTELDPEELDEQILEGAADEVSLNEVVIDGAVITVDDEDDTIAASVVHPVVEVPGAASPVVELPGSAFPVVEVPGSAFPVVEVPGAASPVVEVPGSASPVVEVRAKRASKPAAARAARAQESALAGSVLSAQTWKQAFAVATRKGQEAS